MAFHTNFFRIFHPCKLVPHFHVPQFPPVQTAAVNSCLAFSVAPSQYRPSRHLSLTTTVGRIASQVVTVELINCKCMLISLYGLECFSISKHDVGSVGLDFRCHITFYRAMLCIRGTSHGPVSVRPSVRLSVTNRSSTKRRIT